MKKLVSVVNYPITISYNGESIVVSPRQVIKNVDPEKLGEKLPNGIKLVGEI